MAVEINYQTFKLKPIIYHFKDCDVQHNLDVGIIQLVRENKMSKIVQTFEFYNIKCMLYTFIMMIIPSIVLIYYNLQKQLTFESQVQQLKKSLQIQLDFHKKYLDNCQINYNYSSPSFMNKQNNIITVMTYYYQEQTQIQSILKKAIQEIYQKRKIILGAHLLHNNKYIYPNFTTLKQEQEKSQHVKLQILIKKISISYFLPNLQQKIKRNIYQNVVQNIIQNIKSSSHVQQCRFTHKSCQNFAIHTLKINKISSIATEFYQFEEIYACQELSASTFASILADILNIVNYLSPQCFCYEQQNMQLMQTFKQLSYIEHITNDPNYIHNDQQIDLIKTFLEKKRNQITLNRNKTACHRLYDRNDHKLNMLTDDRIGIMDTFPFDYKIGVLLPIIVLCIYPWLLLSN